MSSAPHSRCGVYGNWSNAANRATSCVSRSVLTSAASVSGLHDMYTIRSNRDTNSLTSSPIPALGGSTSTVRRSYDSSGGTSSRRLNRFPASSASVSSSLESLAKATFPAPFASALSRAAATETLLTSVARTARNTGAIAMVKLPLPQYSSRRSSLLRAGAGASPTASDTASDTAADLAHSSILALIPALGCVKPPSSCLYVNTRPSTSISSMT
mmetsp:Transcript_994/g.3751  ORF Transcript_994/g.3751 Transcript_994/m.3751 type:complete len:214 (+) Transcript_994:384-1025(+)